MCGIAGRFHAERLAPAPGWHQRADALLAHRGPDGSGHYADDRCELVHRRLALIDLSPTGHQPMGNEDGSVQLVFASEMKALAAVPGFQPTLDRQACYDFLGLGYIPEPATGFADIQALPKGAILATGPDGPRVAPFHHVRAQPDQGRELGAVV